MSAVPVDEAPQLLSLTDALWTARVLEATAALGLLDQLSSSPKDASELAQACATDPTMTALLLNTLADLGVVHRNGSGGYTSVVGVPALMTTASRIPGGSKLANAVRSGKPLARADTAEGASELYPELVSQLSVLFSSAAQQAAQLLAGSGVDVLDVGAGAAPWTIALARHSPGVRVTVLDLPAVIATTQRAVEAADLGDRFTYLPADMFTCALPPAAYDVVLLANICHLFDEERNRALLHRLRPTVRPGGLLAIIDVLTQADLAAQRWISLYAFFLRLRTSQGAVYPLAAYETWTSDAGFGPVQVEPLSAAPSLCLLACRTVPQSQTAQQSADRIEVARIGSAREEP
jgi:ubiquinone/menaquinone biosynthesis C-methylase UbiE